MDEPGRVFLFHHRLMVTATYASKPHGNRSSWSNWNTLDNGDTVFPAVVELQGARLVARTLDADGLLAGGLVLHQT